MPGAFEKQFVCIVGAPRCGTTSLAKFLGRQPEICFSKVKEPHFFSSHDLSELAEADLRRLLTDDYLPRYFPHCSEEQRILAEASVSYLYMPDRIEPVLKIWPNAKFIIAVRDPLEMLPSLHQRLLYQGDETVEDFSRAWDLRTVRAEGRRIPLTCLDSRVLQYEEIGRLGKYVSAFVDTVGRERCFIAVYDDLMSRPERLYQRLLSFLEIPQRDDVVVPVSRRRKGFKVAWLQRLLKRPPPAARGVLAGRKFRRRIKALDRGSPSPVGKRVLAARAALLRWNRTAAPEVRLTSRVRGEIREMLADDIQRLSRLLERDLRHWLGGFTPAPASTQKSDPASPGDKPPALGPDVERHRHG